MEEKPLTHNNQKNSVALSLLNIQTEAAKGGASATAFADTSPSLWRLASTVSLRGRVALVQGSSSTGERDGSDGGTSAACGNLPDYLGRAQALERAGAVAVIIINGTVSSSSSMGNSSKAASSTGTSTSTGTGTGTDTAAPAPVPITITYNSALPTVNIPVLVVSAADGAALMAQITCTTTSRGGDPYNR